MPTLPLLKGDICEFILRREEGCTWVGGLDRMAVLYVRCCCRAEAAPAACCGRAVLCAVCCTMCHMMKVKCPEKLYYPIILRVYWYVLGRKVQFVALNVSIIV